jgi:hypothetical protein
MVIGVGVGVAGGIRGTTVGVGGIQGTILPMVIRTTAPTIMATRTAVITAAQTMEMGMEAVQG